MSVVGAILVCEFVRQEVIVGLAFDVLDGTADMEGALAIDEQVPTREIFNEDGNRRMVKDCLQHGFVIA